MPRLGIERLPKPKRQYSPRIQQTGFETKDEARSEDQLRAKRLRSKKGKQSNRIDPAAAKKLARLLDRAAAGKPFRTSLASSAYLRGVRNRLGGALWRLVRSSKLQASTFTVLSKRWIRSPDELLTADPRKLLAAFRSDLNKAGAGQATGALIAFVHGEYEPDSGFYVLHVHGVVLGDMVAVLRQLRKRKKYKPSPTGKSGEPAICRPVVISKKPLTSLPRPLTYTLKRYWPSKRIGPVGWGHKKRNRSHSRIPDPHHSEYLLWLDRWKISDVTLLMGIYVSNQGFRIYS